MAPDSAICRKHVRNKSRRDRQQEAAFDTLLRSIERLVGTAEVPGFLTEQLDAIAEHQQHWQQIVDLIPSPPPPPVTPEEIFVINDLNTVVNSETKETLYDLVLERLGRGGFTPEGFAEQLRRDGLFVQGRTCLPDQWRELHPALIAFPLLHALKQRLGADDSAREINFLYPETPLEHFAGLTMASEELASFRSPFVSKVTRQVKAFAIVRPITGAEPRPNYFFFCHSSQRAK